MSWSVGSTGGHDTKTNGLWEVADSHYREDRGSCTPICATIKLLRFTKNKTPSTTRAPDVNKKGQPRRIVADLFTTTTRFTAVPRRINLI